MNIVVSKPLGTRVFEAECLWAFKVAEEDWSFSSCDNIKALFQRMFAGEVCEKFSIAHTKMSYIVRHGLSEVLLTELVDDVNNSIETMTLLLDETTTAQVKKHCDFLVRFWSEKEDQVVTRYLTSTFFAHTSADELQKMVLSILESCAISIDKFANLSTDGPNINKGLHRRLDQRLKEDLHHGLLSFNPCVLHKVHTGFHNGLLQYGKDLENLAFDLHAWFKIAPCKREDFMQVAVDFQNEAIFSVFQRNEALFYRHVECRWLTLVPALQKVEERWNQAKKYFLDFLPSTKKFATTTQQNKRYKKIVDCFNNEKAFLVQLAFVIDVSTVFFKFLLEFQSEGPKVHTIYQSMKEMLLVLMRRFVRAEAVNGVSGKELQILDVKRQQNQLKLNDIDIGAKATRLLQELSPFDQKKVREDMLKFFVSCATFLQRKLPLDNMILVAASCLHPDSRKMQKTVRQIEYLAKMFPHVIEEASISQMKDEWKIYQAEDDNKIVVDTKERVDHYWRKIFRITSSSGAPKYVTLPKLVKSVLSLQNSNADVEMSLSDNKNTCTKDRVNLLPETLIGLRRMKEYARSKGGSHCIVVNDKIIEGMASAKRKDDERILQEKKTRDLNKKNLTRMQEKEIEKVKMLNKVVQSKKALEREELVFQQEEEKVDEEIKLT